jgi:hypothetical protein
MQLRDSYQSKIGYKGSDSAAALGISLDVLAETPAEEKPTRRERESSWLAHVVTTSYLQAYTLCEIARSGTPPETHRDVSTTPEEAGPPQMPR